MKPASKNCIPFLDLKVKLIDDKVETDLFMKRTDHHQYLITVSSHSKLTKCFIVDSQTYVSIGYAPYRRILTTKN